MILSVSRRTDIPAFYSEWFVKRLKEGFVYSRNPVNRKMVSKIILSPDLVEAIVFWTKNAIPLVQYLDEIEKIGYDKYCFLYTITNYSNDIERYLFNKKEIVDNFILLSKRIGKEKMIWRYDPILLNDRYDLNFHKESFKELCEQIGEYCDHVVISFIDIYTRNKGYFKEVSEERKLDILKNFIDIAKPKGIPIHLCCEQQTEAQYLRKTACISCELIKSVTGFDAHYQKDKGQRKECLCLESVDIGAYNTCGNGCTYCYADRGMNVMSKYDLNSPILCDKIYNDDVIKERVNRKIINGQLTLEGF